MVTYLVVSISDMHLTPFYRAWLINLSLSPQKAKTWIFANGIDQDQNAQNVQSYRDLYHPFV